MNDSSWCKQKRWRLSTRQVSTSQNNTADESLRAESTSDTEVHVQMAKSGLAIRLLGRH